MLASSDNDLTDAVKYFWRTRRQQTRKQLTSSKQDQGSRSAVTGGKQMDGFVELLVRFIEDAGIPSRSIRTGDKETQIPGFFRPEKRWDIVVVDKDTLVACIEFKSQVGSFGNNCNNRSEEAIGSATDLWTAFREGAFGAEQPPWLGYLMLLEESPKSLKPVGVKEPHFKVFDEFKGASYARRYEQLMIRLVRERLYNSACLILSDAKSGIKGAYNEPNSSLDYNAFSASLIGRITSHRQVHR
jgi:hypothetical protein